MVRSMTGYGRVQRAVDGYVILFEIKSVNHRFFEFNAKVPRLYGYIEEKIKTYLQSYITRGKVDVFVNIDSADGQSGKVMLNQRLVESYIAALRELRDRYGLDDDISVSSVARYADIFSVLQPPDDEEKVWNAVKAVADEAMEGFMKMRRVEGERMQADIALRADRVADYVDKISRRSPQTVNEYRAKLQERLKELLPNVEVDEERLLTEAAIYADKVSVTEETVRLRSHLKQFSSMLEGDGPVGRKLDFLMQEMNREANTIGSKAADIDIARMVVEIKAELEKIREQIQNIE